MSSQHRRFYNSPVSGVAKYISWIPMEIRGRSIVAGWYGIRTRIPYTLLQLCTHTPWLVCTAVFPAVSTCGRSGECILLSYRNTGHVEGSPNPRSVDQDRSTAATTSLQLTRSATPRLRARLSVLKMGPSSSSLKYPAGQQI